MTQTNELSVAGGNTPGHGQLYDQVRNQMRYRPRLAKIRLYKRSKAFAAPYYYSCMVRGKRYQFCTDTNDYDEAVIRALAEKKRLQAGLPEDALVAGLGNPRVMEVCNLYRIITCGAAPETKERNIWCMIRLLKIAGLPLTATCMELNRAMVKKCQYYMIHHGFVGSFISYMRQARSIFTPRAIDEYQDMGMTLPDMKGFMKTPLPVHRNVGFIPPPQEWVQMIYACSPIDWRLYNVHLISLYTGLRAREQSLARKEWLQCVMGKWVMVVPAEVTKNGKPRVIPVPAEVAQELLANADKEGFLLTRAYKITRCPPRETKEDRRYLLVIEDYADWLKSMGLKSKKKSHEIRKLFGSMVASKHGLFAAQRLLGHSSPSVTSQYYAALLTMPEPIQSGWQTKQQEPVKAPPEALESPQNDADGQEGAGEELVS